MGLERVHGKGRCLLQQAHGLFHLLLRHAERNDLHRADHFAVHDRHMAFQAGEGHRRVDAVQSVHHRAIRGEEAVDGGMQVDATRARRRHRMVISTEGRGDAVRGFVLAEVAGFETDDDDLRQAGPDQRLHIVG